MQQNKTCIFIFLPTYLGSFPNYFHRFTFFFLFAISQLKHKITPFLITLLCILNAIPINHNTIWNFYKCIKEPYRESYWIFWYQKNPMSHISIYCLFRWLFCKKKKTRTNFYYHRKNNVSLGMGTSTCYNDIKVKC